jgi:uncharacterized protein
VEELPRCRRTTWREIDALADTVASAVRATGPAPDTIVGLTRGGWVPARMLADRLGVKRMLALRAQHWGVTATANGRAELGDPLTQRLEGRNVLVVDDITDTGESLALATEHVASLGPSSLQSAALLHIAHSKFRPTFWGEEIPRDAWVWVVFPWNYWEDLASLAERAAPIAPGVEGIRRTLRERCGLDVPAEDLRRLRPGDP